MNHPNLRSAQEPEGPDYLAGAVLQGLGRPIGEKLSWPLARTFVLGIVSFGLIPILYLPKLFRHFVVLEQQQLWHLAEWLRLHVQNPEAAKLRRDADSIHFRSDLRLLSTLCVAFVGVIFFTQIRDYHASLGVGLLDTTFMYHVNQWPRWGARALLARRLFMTWTLGMGAAYVFHWMQVQIHAASVRNFIRRFNLIAASEGLTPLSPANAGAAGLRPLWVFSGLLMAAIGAIWGVPMMLAAAAQRQVIRSASTRNRAAMAHRLRAMLLARRPSARVPIPVYLRRLCNNERCRAPVQDSATFCPRCGSRVEPPLHRVA